MKLECLKIAGLSHPCGGSTLGETVANVLLMYTCPRSFLGCFLEIKVLIYSSRKYLCGLPPSSSPSAWCQAACLEAWGTEGALVKPEVLEQDHVNPE